MKKEEYITQLEKSVTVLEDLIRTIPADRLTREFGGTVWSVHTHIHHLALTQSMLQKRIQLFLKQAFPQIVPYFPGDEGKKPVLKPIPELVALFKNWRTKQIDSVKTAEESVWNKKAIHPQYEEYSFHILLRHILLHDYFHYYRIEELGLLKPENIKPL